MVSPKVEQITPGMTLGEGPHWDHNAKVLYFVDVLESTVNKYDPATKKLTSVKIDGGLTVSIIIPVEGEKDQFVITFGRNIAIMTWDGVSSKPSDVKIVSTVESDDDGKADNRFNDGKADPKGRLWTGTMGPHTDVGLGKFIPEVGSLYSFDKNWKATTRETGITVSNGLAWSKDKKQMYYVDSQKCSVDVFDYDVKTANISNRRVAFDFEKHEIEGFPDGIAIDTEEKLWVAVFLGSEVIRVDPSNGELLARIPIPSRQTTSVTFGGPELNELYVTSANIQLTPEQSTPESGATFRVTGIGAKGYPGQNIVI